MGGYKICLYFYILIISGIVIKDLIEKYYSGTCSDAEKQEIKQFFQEHPEEMEQYFDLTEWESYQADCLAPSSITDDFLKSLGTAVESTEPDSDQIADKPFDRLSGSRFKYIWIAACLCVALGFGYYLLMPFLQKNSHGQEASSEYSATTYFIHENTSGVVQSFILPDGSEVVLSAGSIIKYLRDFKGATRDMYLSGEAVFKVHKDPARPFTVYCGEVATTAIGTVFRVEEQNNRSKVAVTLLEGKILVRSTDSNTTNSKTYYLLPGHQIAYSRVEKQFSLIENGQKTENAIADASPKKLSSDIIQIETPVSQSESSAAHLSITQSKQAIQFNDVGLAEVLDLLAEKRGVQIVYPTNKVANIKFIGTVNDKTPIEKVLSDIAVMNDLKFSKDSLSGKLMLR